MQSEYRSSGVKNSVWFITLVAPNTLNITKPICLEEFRKKTKRVICASLVAQTSENPYTGYCCTYCFSKQDTHAQIEDTQGRGQALQKDWHWQNQARSVEDAPHPHVEVDQD
jgi:hypothetical protein